MSKEYTLKFQNLERMHLNVASQNENNAIKRHILSCAVCSNVRNDLNSFEVLKQCKSDFQSKIYEALLININLI